MVTVYLMFSVSMRVLLTKTGFEIWRSVMLRTHQKYFVKYYGSFPFTGPMLSSGMCTEVFQFDASPASAPGAIIPAPSVSSVPAKHLKNATRLSKGRNRRILNRLPIPVAGSNYNITEEHVRNSSQKESFQGNKSSSMIVSVLIDPREAGDSEVDGMIAPKSLSRIFVVVLMDSVKYVTYSCVLPRSGLI